MLFKATKLKQDKYWNKASISIEKKNALKWRKKKLNLEYKSKNYKHIYIHPWYYTHQITKYVRAIKKNSHVWLEKKNN